MVFEGTMKRVGVLLGALSVCAGCATSVESRVASAELVDHGGFLSELSIYASSGGYGVKVVHMSADEVVVDLYSARNTSLPAYYERSIKTARSPRIDKALIGYRLIQE